MVRDGSIIRRSEVGGFFAVTAAFVVAFVTPRIIRVIKEHRPGHKKENQKEGRARRGIPPLPNHCTSSPGRGEGRSIERHGQSYIDDSLPLADNTKVMELERAGPAPPPPAAEVIAPMTSNQEALPAALLPSQHLVSGLPVPESVPESTVTSLEVLRAVCPPPPLGRVTSLTLPGEGLKDWDIPPSISKLGRALREVNLSGNHLTQVPEGVLGLRGAWGAGLRELNLGKNAITVVPPEIGLLTGLVSLNLMGNRLTSLPEEVGQLSSLERLGLKDNALEQLPSSLGKLTSLVELYLTGNKLESLPDQVLKGGSRG
ncbi:unnamed protein product [Discosporangium mesarthrocarpum]